MKRFLQSLSLPRDRRRGFISVTVAVRRKKCGKTAQSLGAVRKAVQQGVWGKKMVFPQGLLLSTFLHQHSTKKCGKFRCQIGVVFRQRRRGSSFWFFSSREKERLPGEGFYSYLALILVVMSLTISAFRGSFFTRSSMRFRALSTVVWSRLNSRPISFRDRLVMRRI